MEKKPSIGIFLFSYPLGVSDVITQTARRLSEAGYDIDVFVDEVSFSQSPFNFEGSNIRIVQVVLSASSSGLREAVRRWPSLENFLDRNTSFPRFPLYLSQVLDHSRARSHHLLVGVEPFGLIVARFIQLCCAAPLLYYNMELFQRRNCHSEDMIMLKELEIEASEKCSFTIIQDEERARVYAQENEISRDRLLFLPVSTSGPRVTKKSDFFRNLFDLPPEKKIIIYAGHIIDWAMCREIVEAARLWPENYVLVMNSWKASNAKEKYFQETIMAAGRNCFFNTNPIPHEHFPEALSSADAALMFYRPIDENFTETGSSSNKLAHYFQAGLPVVASSFASVQQIFDRYSCGLTVNHPKNAVHALAALFENYDYYRQGAYNAFRDHYDFERVFSSVQEEIEALLKSSELERNG